ncbi:RapZ C-terminal domain-containing protein [Streptomyces botrytidirepellens]|uniref:RapZ C-terminal domain-containing protein n=1 Tax=Streptomyces botrytidirepellens TaxID=2486417 RepID=A0A3M8W7F5_9ACTN|nr:RNase adapter RapZ [Streptomyces botrytidirepellens]RNG26038.1 hypothetical protein EEJ42_16335 [Streptomyces botrytidirepellens]
MPPTTLTSFGYLHLHGAPPPAADRVEDVREQLHQPAAAHDIHHLTGLTPHVQDLVLATPGARALLDNLTQYATSCAPTSIAVGCTDSRHRASALVELLGQRLRERGLDIAISHRHAHLPDVQQQAPEKEPRRSCCDHSPGEPYPGDRPIVAAFTRMLVALKEPAPWTEDDDLAVQIPAGVERARVTSAGQHRDRVGLVLLHPDTATALTQPMSCPQTLILGPWNQAYRPLTHIAQGKHIADTQPEGGLTNPEVRCPQCHGTSLEVTTLRYPSGGADVASFTCSGCAASWEPWETPAPVPEGPNYLAAYLGAPPLADEEAELQRLANDINDRATAALTGNGPSVPSVDHRRLLLRRAALRDRTAHRQEEGWYLGNVSAAQVNHGSTLATQAAHTLLTWDREHDEDHVAGPFGPDSPTWNTASGSRAYVRQEYQAMLAQAQEADDRAHMEPRRGPDGELRDALGQPL